MDADQLAEIRAAHDPNNRDTICQACVYDFCVVPQLLDEIGRLRAEVKRLQPWAAAWVRTGQVAADDLADRVADVADLREQVTAKDAAIAAVLELHKPWRHDTRFCEECGDPGGPDPTPYPCPTRKALGVTQ